MLPKVYSEQAPSPTHSCINTHFRLHICPGLPSYGVKFLGFACFAFLCIFFRPSGSMSKRKIQHSRHPTGSPSLLGTASYLETRLFPKSSPIKADIHVCSYTQLKSSHRQRSPYKEHAPACGHCVVTMSPARTPAPQGMALIPTSSMFRTQCMLYLV